MKRVAAAVAGLVIVLVGAGCSAGQDTQTDSMEPAVNGALGQVGPIAIRDAQLAASSHSVVIPAGSEVALRVTLVNTGSADDELAEVTSAAGDEVEISGDRRLVAGRSIAVGGGGGSEAPSSSSLPPSTSSSPTGSATTRPTTTSAAPKPVELGKATIVLKGLNQPLQAGKTYAVTFVFRNAGSVTVQVPIANPPGARPEPTGESH